jgi:hypothetical protein
MTLAFPSEPRDRCSFLTSGWTCRTGPRRRLPSNQSGLTTPPPSQPLWPRRSGAVRAPRGQIRAPQRASLGPVWAPSAPLPSRVATAVSGENRLEQRAELGLAQCDLGYGTNRHRGYPLELTRRQKGALTRLTSHGRGELLRFLLKPDDLRAGVLGRMRGPPLAPSLSELLGEIEADDQVRQLVIDALRDLESKAKS